MTTRNIRFTRRHFLPPPTYKEIKDAGWIDGYNGRWMFHSDKVKTQVKQWAIFDSDQWEDDWKIIYHAKKDKSMNWVEPNDVVTIFSREKEITMKIISSYPSRRICRTYIVTIQSINDINN